MAELSDGGGWWGGFSTRGGFRTVVGARARKEVCRARYIIYRALVLRA
jgi:hypothetical protein